MFLWKTILHSTKYVVAVSCSFQTSNTFICVLKNAAFSVSYMLSWCTWCRLSLSIKFIWFWIELPIFHSTWHSLPNLFVHIYSFNTLKKKSIGKHCGKKVILLKMSNFTFFHNFFCAIWILKSLNSHISVFIRSFFEFWMVSKWCIMGMG